MLDKIYYYVIMVPMVYAAASVFVIGVISRSIRIVLAPRQKTTIQVFPAKRPTWLHALIDTFLMPTVKTIRLVMRTFAMVFHGALVLLVIGHLELIGKFRALQAILHQVFLGGPRCLKHWKRTMSCSTFSSLEPEYIINKHLISA